MPSYFQSTTPNASAGHRPQCCSGKGSPHPGRLCGSGVNHIIVRPDSFWDDVEVVLTIVEGLVRRMSLPLTSFRAKNMSVLRIAQGTLNQTGCLGSSIGRAVDS